MENKSIVALQLCFICRKEATGVLMQMKNINKPMFDEFGEGSRRIGLDVCVKCKKKYLKNGVLLIGCNEVKKVNQFNQEITSREPTGNFCVLKNEAFLRIFNKPFPFEKIVYCDEEVLNKLR